MRRNKDVITHTRSGSVLAAACAALIPTRDTIRSSGQSNTRVIQNVSLVWLDINGNEVNNYNTLTLLRHIVNTVHTFTKVNECIEFLNGMKEENVFMIISGTIDQTTMPVIHDIPLINSIYVLCENKLEHELWIQKWSKIKGVFMELVFLFEALKVACEEYDRNTIPMSFIEIKEKTLDYNLDEIDQSFIYAHILKDIVSKIHVKQQDIKEFINYYRKQIIGNSTEQRNVDTFEREYHDYGATWWYTYPCFLRSMVNRSLCTIEIDTIIKMGFFLHDLHEHITRLYTMQNVARHDKASFIVYRGQGMSQVNFDRLKKTQNGFLSFNNFLSASKNRQISLDFARQTISTSDLVGVLFVMTIDPLKPSTPFANIRDNSCVQTEEEILFSLHSVFRIDQIKQVTNNNHRLWQVELTLIGDNDTQLHALTERIQEETFSHRKRWARWSELLIKQGEFDKAQEMCETAIAQISEADEKGLLNYQIGLIKFSQKDFLEAKSYYHLALEIFQKTLPPEHVDTAACCNAVGLVYEKLENYPKALLAFQNAFEIYQKILPVNHLLLANCNNNIGRIYCQVDEYLKSIVYYEKVLEIHQNILPLNSSNIINAYNNIGSVYEKMGEYKKAITAFEKSLTIQKKTLSPNHLDMADSYNNIGSIYEKMNEYTIAVSHYEKSLEIYEENLPSNHSDLAACNNAIGLVYFQRGDYFQALTFLEKSHEIYRKILPANHPNLAASYACQGAVYEEMSKYSKALLYYKKAFEIYRNIQPVNHLDLATSYNNLGSVYYQTGEYPTALSCHEKALEIYQKHLSSNHQDLANSYGWHGDIYNKMADYSKALSFYTYALDIGEIALPENHPSLQQWKDNIKLMKEKL